MRINLPRAPLLYVVTLIEFSPIATMRNQYIGKIQDALRMDGYPSFEEKMNYQYIFTPEGPQEHTKNYQWFFGNEPRNACIALSDSTFSLSVCEYDTFDAFCKQMKEAIDIVAPILHLDKVLVKRIGHRYIDLIREIDEIPATKLIKQEYLGGFLTDESTHENIRLCQLISEIKTIEDACLRTMIYSQPGMEGIPFPQEMGNLKPSEEKFNLKKEDNAIILDSDHYKMYTREQYFTWENFYNDLQALHGFISENFKKITTDEARNNLWGKEQRKTP